MAVVVALLVVQTQYIDGSMSTTCHRRRVFCMYNAWAAAAYKVSFYRNSTLCCYAFFYGAATKLVRAALLGWSLLPSAMLRTVCLTETILPWKDA